jgi:hypothetical protein
MSETSVQAVPPPPRRPTEPAVEPPRVRAEWMRWVRKVLRPLASLRLTVVLFVLCMFLVFCGTLAMRDSGLWATLHGYFRCVIAWIPFQVFVPFGEVFFGLPPTLRLPGSFPFPGGWILGGALLINLLAAHIVRFRFTWKRSGILLIHAGLIVMMLGELVTGKFASEGLMPIKIGEYADYIQHTDRVELAFLRDDPEEPGKDRVILVPDGMVKKGGTLDDERLPFRVEVVRFLANSSDLRPRRDDEQTPATRGEGLTATVDEEPSGAGADSSQKTDTPGAYVTLHDKKTGAKLGTYFVWVYLGEQEVEGGGDYRMALRYERSYEPYRIYLEEFHHDVYPGTDTPKNFSSRVRLLSDQGESREVDISMNSPLRYQGETFYQSGTLKADAGTILQVVRNPGASMPYISCAMVCIGMLIHFGIHLLGFLGRRSIV